MSSKTIEPDKNIEVSPFFQKLGFKVSLVDEELWLPLAKFAEVKAQIDQLVNEARLADIERILTASDQKKNKEFSGTWHGDMAAACGEVAKIYKELNNLQDIKEGE